MSLAACDERCARLRTSDATTAKPRPASPARAGFPAALSARAVVAVPISSITLMMSEILRDDSSIRAIASTACATTAPAAVGHLAGAGRNGWPAGRSRRSSSPARRLLHRGRVSFQAGRLLLGALRQVVVLVEIQAIATATREVETAARSPPAPPTYRSAPRSRPPAWRRPRPRWSNLATVRRTARTPQANQFATGTREVADPAAPSWHRRSTHARIEDRPARSPTS